MIRPRTAIGALALSAAALVGIVTQEGYTDRAVVPVKGDVPTIGFGTTGGVKMGDTITPPKALARALTDVQKFEGAIKQCVKVPLHQYEYDAYTSLAYNIGATAFCDSSIPRKLAAGDYEAACWTILDFDRFRDCSKPKVLNQRTGKLECPLVRLPGLSKRRYAEFRQCEGQ